MWWFVDLDNSFDAVGDKSVGYCCIQLCISFSGIGFSKWSDRMVEHREKLTQQGSDKPSLTVFLLRAVGDRANLVWKLCWQELTALAYYSGNSMSYQDSLAPMQGWLSAAWLRLQAGEQGFCSYLDCLASNKLVHGLPFDFSTSKASKDLSCNVILGSLVAFFKITNMPKY